MLLMREGKSGEAVPPVFLQEEVWEPQCPEAAAELLSSEEHGMLKMPCVWCGKTIVGVTPRKQWCDECMRVRCNLKKKAYKDLLKEMIVEA